MTIIAACGRVATGGDLRVSFRRILRKIPGSSASRLNRTFCCVGVAINHLKVRQSPIPEQFRPSVMAMVTPDKKQWDTVIYLGVPPEPSTGLAAAAALQSTQECYFTVWCIPELPGNDASTMPDRFFV